VHEVALSDANGTAVLSTPVFSGRPALGLASVSKSFPGAHLDTVKTATLDSYELLDISLIKIDVEGHEAAVLGGAVRTIERERPTLIVEIEPRHGADVASLISSIKSLGYYMRPQLSAQNHIFEPL
jgi:FkbM family methyltransferase